MAFPRSQVQRTFARTAVLATMALAMAGCGTVHLPFSGPAKLSGRAD